MKKTFKREVGWILLALLVVLGVLAIFQSAEAMELIRITIGPIIGYNGVAHGMDAVSKQTTWGGHPEEMQPRHDPEGPEGDH